jgi:hypothetical protein
MMHSQLHGGKWSQEEEIYASALIDAFTAGELPGDDIEEGKSPNFDLSLVLAKKNNLRESLSAKAFCFSLDDNIASCLSIDNCCRNQLEEAFGEEA